MTADPSVRLNAEIVGYVRAERIDEARLSRFEISVDGGLATARFQAACRLISADIMVARHVSGWKIELVRAGESWRVRAVVPVRSRSLPYDSLADLPR